MPYIYVVFVVSSKDDADFISAVGTADIIMVLVDSIHDGLEIWDIIVGIIRVIVISCWDGYVDGDVDFVYVSIVIIYISNNLTMGSLDDKGMSTYVALIGMVRIKRIIDVNFSRNRVVFADLVIKHGIFKTFEVSANSVVISDHPY